MKKISLKNLNLKEVDQLSREQLKNVLGGWNDLPTTTKSDCGCVLKSSSGVSLNFPISSTVTTEEGCKTACKTACDGANSVGGDCASHSWTFVSVTE